MCEDAKSRSRFRAVTAASGLGKTTALKRFASITPNTYYTLCDVTMGRKDFLREILRSMGVDDDGSIYGLTRSIISKLNSTDRPLIILDDAGKLNDACMKLLQVIYDATEFHADIVIGGTPYLKNTIITMAAKDKQGYCELKRRIAHWQPLYAVSVNILTEICANYGITDFRAVNLVKKLAPDYGSLREIMTNYSIANKEGKSQVDVLTALHVGSEDEAA